MHLEEGLRKKLIEEFWQHTLGSYSPSDAFDFCKTKGSNTPKEEIAVVIPGKLVENVHQLCSNSEFLTYTFHLSVLHLLLGYYNNSEETLTGGYLIGHKTADTLHEQIVFYRSKINRKISFKQFFTELKEKAIDISKQQGMSKKKYEKLFPGDVFNHLFNIGFVIHDIHGKPVTSDFDILVRIDKARNTRFIIEFYKEGYDAGLLKRFAQNYVHLLQEVVRNLYVPVDQLSFIHSVQVTELHSFNTVSKTETYKTIHALFEKQAAKSKDQPAVIFNEEYWTYKELNSKANRLAHYLRGEYDTGPDKLIGVMISKSNWTVATLLAILKAGGAYVPIDPEYPKHRIRYLIDNSGIALLITESDLFFKLDFYTGTFLVLDVQFDLLPENDENLPSSSSPDDLAYMIYTSGSTGEPKGVMIAHKSICNTLLWRRSFYGLDEKAVNLQLPSYAFDSSVEDIFSILISGGTLVIPNEGLKTDPDYVKGLITKHSVSHLLATPSLYQFLLEEIPDVIATLTAATVAGEAVHEALVNSHYQGAPQVELINEYGPTENAVCSTAGRLRPHENVHIGSPIDNINVYILNEVLEIVPIGVKGELCVAGIGLAKGYYKADGLTAERFVTTQINEKPVLVYKTGDNARWLPNGTIEYLGRNDSQVKVRGYRIEIGEVEKLISGLPQVKQCAVIAEDLGEKGKQLVGFIVPREANDIPLVMNSIRKQLPHYMVPGKLLKIDAIPLTIHGKTDYDKLATLEAAQKDIPDNANYVLPATLLQKKLAEIWQQVLDKEKIGITDDFFVLGGHSIKAVQIISRIQRELNVKIEIKTLFSDATIGTLSQTIEKESPSVEFSPIESYAKDDNIYELSNAQKRLWFLSQFEAGSSAYNSTTAFMLKGELKIDLLGNAFDRLIERHESLRTTFITVEGEPRQYIHEQQLFAFEIETVDLTNDETAEETAKNIAEIDAVKPFDLEKGPLLRVTVIKLSDQQNILLLSVHHIVSDGWSITVLFNDIIKIYNNLLDGTAIELPPLKIQYKDYTAWQNTMLNSVEFKDHEKFWLGKFKGDIPVLEVLTDRPRPAVKSYNGRFHPYKLGSQHTKMIRHLASKFDTSTFVVLQSIIKALLYKYTGQTDIIIGSLIAGRDHIDLEDQIGFYVNTIPLRTAFNEDNTFDEFILNIKRNTLDAFSHSRYPFDVLIDKLDITRSLNRSPLFDVLLVLQNVEFKTTQQLKDISISPFAFEFNTSKFDLSFYFTEKDEDHIDIKIEYDTDLFVPERIDRLFDHLRSLLDSIALDSGQPLKTLTYSTDGDMDQLNSFNATKTSYDHKATIHGLFEQQLQKNKHATALTYNNTSLTYEDLEKSANKVAHCLVSQGISVGEPVAVLLDRSEQMLIALLGILKAGAAYIPVDPLYPLERMEYMIGNTASRLLISESKYIDTCDVLQWEIDSLTHYLCLDIMNTVDHSIYENESKELWDYVADRTDDASEASGWISSYSGTAFHEEEIKEMVANVCIKVQPFISKDTVVLEIGCGSGLITTELAPKVKQYYGTDISEEALKICSDALKENSLSNVILHCLSALEIASLQDIGFDLIIVNSVVQYFPSHQYLREFLSIVSGLLKENGVLFIGDIRDKDLQYDYYHSLPKGSQPDNPNLTKKKYSESELFLTEAFFTDYFGKTAYQSDVKASKKIGAIKNELSLFRFDILVQVDKKAKTDRDFIPHKYQLSDKEVVTNSDQKTGRDVSGTDLAYIIYTSGSTGRPKGVEILHSAVVNFLFSMKQQLRFGKNDSILATTTYTFDISVLEFFLPLITGGLLHIAPKESTRDGMKFRELLEQAKPGFLQATPSFWKMLIDSGWKGNTAMNLLAGGEYLDPALGGQLLNMGAALYNLYGPTETTIWSTLQQIESIEDLRSIGKPIDNTSIYILDAQGKILPVGIEGEMYIGGHGLARGYRNNTELTQSKFVISPEAGHARLYRTGDLGRWFIEGRLEYRGRIDNQVKIRGYRIEPGEVELAIRTSGMADDAVVCARQDHTNDNVLAAYLVATSPVDVPSLRKHLAQSLPSYMIPTYFVAIDSIPLTPNGKINYKQLPAVGEVSMNSYGGDHVPPDTETEMSIARIWEHVLGIKNPGITDNFFEIGGHSIRATQVVSRIYASLKVKIDIKHIFLYPTITTLAKYLQKLQKEVNVEIPLAEKDESYRMSNAQKRLWIFSQLNKKSTAYNMPGVYSIRGKLHLDILEEALAYLVKRHEILRTSFQMHKGEPRQLIHEYDSLDIHIKRIDKPALQNDEQGLKRLVEEEVKVPFELSEAPLFKACCIRTGDEKQLFLFVIHHSIADAWSVRIIIDELFETYKAGVQNKQPDLPPLRIQYKDYCEWQLNAMRLDKMLKSREFWMDKFSTIPTPLNLPADFQRGTSRGYNGSILTLKLNDELLEKIKIFNKENTATMFTTLLAGVKLLLFKYTSSPDIVIGVPVAGRNHLDMEHQIGFYVNTLPIRTFFNAEDNFIQAFGKVKDEWIASSGHQEYPFDNIINDVPYTRDTTRSPLFDVLVELLEEDEDPFKKFNAIGLEVDHFETETCTSKFDLSFKFRLGKNLYLDLEYNTDLFMEQTIRRIYAHWLSVVHAVCDAKQNTIGRWELADLPHLTEELS